ncbi:hypothetical protein [Devosia sp.]|uniref:hypothetical protein n=1 Tax=Devosia sp. TaxID=1871048 RepID=UPI003A8F27CD
MNTRRTVTSIAGFLTAVAVGFIGFQVLASDRPIWDSTVGELIGTRLSPTPDTPSDTAPAPVTIEFVLDQCAPVSEDLPQLASNEVSPEPVASPPEPIVSPPEPVVSQPEQKAAPAEAVASPPEPVAVPAEPPIRAPDSDNARVAPSPERSDRSVPLKQGEPVEISPSIIYLP